MHAWSREPCAAMISSSAPTLTTCSQSPPAQATGLKSITHDLVAQLYAHAHSQLLRDVDLEDGRAADLEDVWGVENPAGWGPAGLGGAQGVAGGAQGVAVISVIAVRAAL